MWVYIKSEPNLYTVGFYDPEGNWHPDSDHKNKQKAANRTAFLNGSPDIALRQQRDELAEVCRALTEQAEYCYMDDPAAKLFGPDAAIRSMKSRVNGLRFHVERTRATLASIEKEGSDD